MLMEENLLNFIDYFLELLYNKLNSRLISIKDRLDIYLIYRKLWFSPRNTISD